MRHFQRHQLSKKHAAAVATPVNVFEKILKDFRAGKAVPSGLQFPSEGANNEVLRAASTARSNFPNTVNVFEGPLACPQAM